MAHRFAKALERPSAHMVKKTDWWGEITDRIAGCILASQLDEVEDWLAAREMDYPRSWDTHLEELIEKKRDEIASEDIAGILRDKYDFT